MRLLLLSNSTTHGYGYLEHAEKDISEFFGSNTKKIAFVPYAGVTISYDDYFAKVNSVFSKLGYELLPIHKSDNPADVINSADSVAVGGGNTFHLLHELYRLELVQLIRDKVNAGMPYIGWSAGSNMACPTIKTTNDMPIIEPKSFNAFNLVPFQINPHYTDAKLENHYGETREQRLEEYLKINTNIKLLGLREGCILKIEDGMISHIGDKSMRVWNYKNQPIELSSVDDLSFLLK